MEIDYRRPGFDPTVCLQIYTETKHLTIWMVNSAYLGCMIWVKLQYAILVIRDTTDNQSRLCTGSCVVTCSLEQLLCQPGVGVWCLWYLHQCPLILKDACRELPCWGETGLCPEVGWGWTLWGILVNQDFYPFFSTWSSMQDRTWWGINDLPGQS